MRRLLIVDSSEIFIELVRECCCQDFEIRGCCDGPSALEQLSAFGPDVLIINLSLPFKDGLAVLREAPSLPRHILAVNNLANPFVSRTLGALGVSCELNMPTPRTVVSRMAEVLQDDPAVRPDLRAGVVAHLQRLRFRSNLDGYRMLCVGLPLYMRDTRQLLGKELYPAIIQALGTGDARSVEHSIRNAIEDAWKARDDAVWAKYFPPDPGGKIPCPRVKHFLSRLAQVMQMENI